MKRIPRPPRPRGDVPVVAVTMGDPAGVGPELCLRAVSAPELRDGCVPLVFGDLGVLRRVARSCGLPSPRGAVSLARWKRGLPPKGTRFVDCGAIDPGRVQPGQVLKACGQAAYRYIRIALRAALDGRVAGIATGPIHKEALRLAGVPYPGHTELLAALTHTRRYCMMMASDRLKVGLVTTHLSYRAVPRALRPKRIEEVIELTADAMRRLGCRSPLIGVCALNPHAGEGGLFGREERDLIAPAIERARAAGIRITGPLPPDTAFLAAKRRVIDAYVAMYHDQGLIPFKVLGFERGVNITLGLPVVRTSVDHGTAFDIAWQGKASARSLIESILWAARLAGARGAASDG